MGKVAVLIALSVASLGASQVQAQACLGLPSFAGGSVHLNAAAEFPDSATVYAGAISGGRNGLFASLGGGQVSYDYSNIDTKSTLVFLEVGMERSMAGVQLCPVAGGYRSSGPNDRDVGIEVTSNAAAAGLAAGMPLGNRSFQVIPNAALRYQYTSQTVAEENNATSSEGYHDGWVDFGLGLVIRDRVSLQPLAHVPLFGEGGEVSYGVFVAASLGWRAR